MPSGGLQQAVLALSGLYALMSVLTAALAPSAERAMQEAADAGRDSLGQFTAYDAVGALALPLTVGVWVVTCLWLSRARQNAALLRPDGQRRSPAWVWLGWIIPIVSFWFPYQVVTDILRTTAPAVGDTAPARTGPWWGSWLVVQIIGGIQAALAFSITLSSVAEGSTVNGADTVSPVLDAVVAVLTLVSLVLWVGIVRRISSIQDRLAAGGPQQLS
jgi:cytochrome bd-type quinol oxidase subunit 2